MGCVVVVDGTFSVVCIVIGGSDFSVQLEYGVSDDDGSEENTQRLG